MAELEKTIKGLECCTYDLPLDNKVHKSDICKNCPYYNPETSLCLNTNYLMKDALELLKEQQEKIDGLLEDLATAIDDKDSALLMLKEQDRSKHGHWIVLENCSNAGVYCSECHTKMFDRYPMKKKFSQYCGHCGAHNDLQVEVR